MRFRILVAHYTTNVGGTENRATLTLLLMHHRRSYRSAVAGAAGLEVAGGVGTIDRQQTAAVVQCSTVLLEVVLCHQ